MALVAIDERFQVHAPVGPVWDHLVDPRRVVACVPGGELEQVIDARTYLGRVRVKVGPLPLAFRGRVHLAEVDEAAWRVKIVGQARESAGAGSARMTLVSGLTALPEGATLVVARIEVEVAGRLVRLGRGFLEQPAHQLFQDFAGRVTATVEARQAGRIAPASPPPVRALPVLFSALRAWVSGLLRPRRAPRPAHLAHDAAAVAAPRHDRAGSAAAPRAVSGAGEPGGRGPAHPGAPAPSAPSVTPGMRPVG